MCGNMTVRTQSVSSGLKDKSGNINVSSQTQVRPLIYPSELTRLNNAKSTGNSIVVTFNNFPLMTKFTPSYKCPLYEIGQMDLTDVRANVFFGDDVFYDLDERNYIILDENKEGEEDGEGDVGEVGEEQEAFDGEVQDIEGAEDAEAAGYIEDDRETEEAGEEDYSDTEDEDEDGEIEDEDDWDEDDDEDEDEDDLEEPDAEEVIKIMEELMADYMENSPEEDEGLSQEEAAS